MLFDVSEIRAASCSREERAALAGLADRMAEMAGTVEKEGLFALGRYAEEHTGFLAEAVGLALEGSGGAKTALREAALSSEKRGRALLERLMISQGLAGITSGEGADLVRLKVGAYTGTEFFFREDQEEAIQSFMNLGFDRSTAEQLSGIN